MLQCESSQGSARTNMLLGRVPAFLSGVTATCEAQGINYAGFQCAAPADSGRERDASRVAAVRQGDVQTKQRNIHIIHSGDHFLFKHTVFNVNVFRVCLEVSFDGLWVAFRGRGKW